MIYGAIRESSIDTYSVSEVESMVEEILVEADEDIVESRVDFVIGVYNDGGSLLKDVDC